YSSRLSSLCSPVSVPPNPLPRAVRHWMIPHPAILLLRPYDVLLELLLQKCRLAPISRLHYQQKVPHTSRQWQREQPWEPIHSPDIKQLKTPKKTTRISL